MTKKLTTTITTLVLIALILTLPLRAVAGVALAHSAVGPTGGGEAVMQMQGGMQSMHCHDRDQRQADDRHHEQPGPDHHAHAGCNVCADCCIGAVSPPVPFRFTHLDKPQSTPIPLFERAYAGFQPDGPERPPRSSAL